MWLSQLLIDSSTNSGKRCRDHIITGILSVLLRAVALGTVLISRDHVFVLYLEPGYRKYTSGFYGGTGAGLMAADTMTVVRSMRYLKDPEFRKARKTYETDERNRLLGLRCWAYTGHTVMILLYTGTLAGGFISLIISRALMAMITCYGVILVVFRRMLQKAI